ncbi:MAG: enoyl-CoA hydratase [Betaproteobacteria bacterium RIFCSPLOWO2_02_67_12]|nr:MAG: enoyl-CoA hydratase [Betaproteobacteria bacterium RIFCSPLOWO2_02_67_12]HLE67722.1 enoyl-CoA hydratase [Burkholderiales bacterium]
MNEDYDDILLEVKERLARITLNRPEKLNAWTPAMGRSLRRAVAACAANDEVRAIVITGAGRGFCAGADMDVLQKIRDGSARRATPEAAQTEESMAPARPGLDVAQHYRSRFGYLFAVPKPVIAAINGPCAGLGFVFALYCDLRFASAEAIFTTSFAQRGLIAEHGIAWLLPRLVGSARALDLLLSARKFDGSEAERIGLVQRAFPHEALMGEAMGYARRLAEQVSPRSMAVMKAQVWSSPFQDFNAALAIADTELTRSFASEDFREGVAHYLEKRAPRFSGR